MRALAFVALLVAPGFAWACSGVPCGFDSSLANVSVPANTPALAVDATYAVAPELDIADGGFELLTANGQPIAGSVERSDDRSVVLVRPLQPLTAGQSLVFRYPRDCQGRSKTDVPFTTSSTQPMPTTLGSFSVKAKGHGTVSIPGGSSCLVGVGGAYAQFAFVPAAELVPFLAVTRWSLLIDGKVWAREPPGAVGANGLVATIPYYRARNRVLEINVPCAPQTLGVGVELGQHTAELQGTIAGVAQPLTASTAFTLACSGPSDTPTPIDEGGMSQLPTPGGCSSVPGMTAALVVLVFRRARRASVG
ncbi:MAG: hypothetical protein Q8L14_31305 [Myxococcales bacterium]|nr:hypothetical protein [Myxococcales bacterium]